MNHVRIFIVEYEKEGQRVFYRESLPARAAFQAAKQLAVDGFKPRVIRFRLDREQVERLKVG